MRKLIKALAYRSARQLGLFRASRALTRRRLRILAYHGFTLDDESVSHPQLFMDAARFAKRLQFLEEQGYPVLPLAEAVSRLQSGTLPDCAVVITVDDGFYSFYELAVPLLAAREMPSTLYLTTYYCEHQAPIFNLVVQYMLRRTQATRLDLDDLQVPGGGVLDPQDIEARERARNRIVEHGQSLPDEPSRIALSRTLGRLLGVSYDGIEASRKLSLMSTDEVRHAMNLGVDVQLHTHRHRFPDNAAAVRREIHDNRRVLQRITGRWVTHLCYPSGVFHRRQFPVLEAAGVASATTCEPGLCDPEQPALELGRFLDNDSITDIEFEAELSGFQDLLRQARAAILDRRPEFTAPRLPTVNVPWLQRVLDLPVVPPWSPAEAADRAPRPEMPATPPERADMET